MLGLRFPAGRIKQTAEPYAARIVIHQIPEKNDRESPMSSASTPMTLSQRIGLTVFILAILLTATMFIMGANNIPLPKWVLVLTTVL